MRLKLDQNVSSTGYFGPRGLMGVRKIL